MAMNFDTYNTSFQSLMKPMYNVNSNYALAMGGYPGAGYAGMAGAGYLNPAMMGMYASGPMANVAVGQFSASTLLPAEDQMNNYYARPIAAHKKENDTGTILGMLATALGTAAMLAALTKGKVTRVPRNVNRASKTMKMNSVGATNGTNGTNGVTKGTGSTTNGTRGTGGNTNGTNGVTNGTGGVTNGAGNSNVAGYLPPHTPSSRWQNAMNKKAAAMNQPSSGRVIVTPPPAGAAGSSATGASTGNLPTAVNNTPQVVSTPAQRHNFNNWKADAQDVEFIDLPAPTTNGKVNLKPITEYYKTENPTFNIPHRTYGPIAALPAPAPANLPAVTPKINLKPITEYYNTGRQIYNIPSGAPKAALPSPAAAANEKLISVRPDLANKGEVVYTTQTPQSMSNGYSIGSNAKGADKLAELLAKMSS